jgi:hypothetical protein
MGTKRVQMKGDLPSLVHWAGRAGTEDFCSALAALVSRDKIFFSSQHTISMYRVAAINPEFFLLTSK